MSGTIVHTKKCSGINQKPDDCNVSCDYTFTEDTSALRVVRAIDQDTVGIAQPSLPIENATALGVTSNSVLTGKEGEIITFGELEDPFFNFPASQPLFLGNDGLITATPPTMGVLTQIGHGMGPGKIFINIQDPICL